MNGVEGWRRYMTSTRDGDWRVGMLQQVSATEQGIKLGNSIWRRTWRGEDFQLADLFPWPSLGVGISLFVC